MGPEAEPGASDDQQAIIRCTECGRPFKTTQGLAGHRRLAHSGGDAEDLETREEILEEQERALAQQAEELAERKREIETTGPRSIGLVRCDDCGGWYEGAKELTTHNRSVHPIDEAIAAEAGVRRQRVDDVWTEACRKSEQYPAETPEQIIKRFWNLKDREILRRLRGHNAAFRFAKEG